jgi:hypothetical protein
VIGIQAIEQLGDSIQFGACQPLISIGIQYSQNGGKAIFVRTGIISATSISPRCSRWRCPTSTGAMPLKDLLKLGPRHRAGQWLSSHFEDLIDHPTVG